MCEKGVVSCETLCVVSHMGEGNGMPPGFFASPWVSEIFFNLYLLYMLKGGIYHFYRFFSGCVLTENGTPPVLGLYLKK